MGPREGFQGRLVIEAWEANESSGDGLRFTVEDATVSTPEGAQAFVRDVVARMHQRVNKP